MLEFIKAMEFHQTDRGEKTKSVNNNDDCFSVIPLRVSVVPVGLLVLWVPWRVNS